MATDTHHLISTMEFKKRTEIHFARKLWHMGAVSTMAAIYAYAPEKLSFFLLFLFWSLFVPLDFMRQKSPRLNDLLVHLFRPLMRDSELHRLAGTSYLLTGVGFIVLVFPRDVVLLTLLFLAFADPLASYFGIKYGKDKIFGHKSLQGTVAAFVVCTVLCFVFFSTHNLLMDRLIVVSLLGGLIGALAELIPVGKLDDNLTLPAMSAFFLYLLFVLFGALA
jgi:dolichol kinase